MGREDRLFQDYRRTRRPALLAQVYDLVGAELFDVALHLTGSVAEAEDALQETFTVAIERADDWDPARRLLPWLLGILTNRARASRRRARREVAEDRVHVPASEDPRESAERGELLELLDASLRDVPAPFQSVLILRLQHGLTAPEIAHALRLPPGTVRSQLQRGLEILRKKLPAGFASAAFVSFEASARGLHAIRADVLARAASAYPAAATSLVGVLVMKKILVAVAAVAATLVAVFFAIAPSEPAEPVSQASVSAVAQPEPPDAIQSLAVPVPAASERRAAEAPIVPSSEASVPTTGELLVRVRSRDDGRLAPNVGVIASTLLEGWTVPRECFVLTDEAGEALFSELLPGPVRVRVPQGSEDQGLVRAGVRTVVEVRAFAGVTVDGRVVDGEDRGVAGAEIWMSERYTPGKGHVVARADADGRFELRAVGPDLYIGARAPSYAVSSSQNVRGSAGDRVPMRIVLAKRGATVSGRVVDRSGAPLAGAVVCVGQEQPRFDVFLDNGQSMPSPPPCRVTTDADGMFAMTSVPLGSLPVVARANGCAPWRGEVLVNEGRNVLDVVLERDAILVGRVLDARGEPAARAWVHTPDTIGIAASSAHSGSDGRFRLIGLPAGSQRIIAEDPKLGRTEVDVVLASGATAERDLVLDPQPRIFGTVRDDRGAPIRDVNVVAFRDAGGESRSRSSPTGPNGEYTVSVGDDGAYTVIVQAFGKWREFPLEVIADVRAGPDPLDIVVDASNRATGSIRGVVVAPEGETRAGIEVAVWHESKRLWRSFPVDADTGAFEIGGVPRGDASIEVQSSTYPKVAFGVKTIEGGETLDLGRIVLERPTRLTIVLDGVDEGALDSLLVLLTDERHTWVPMIAQEPRRWRSGPLAAGRYELRVQGDFLAPALRSFEMTVGVEREERMRMERAGARRVIFRVPEGTPPLARVSCGVHAADGRLVWMNGNVPVAADGSFAVRVSLPDGRYRVFGSTGDGWRGESEIEIAGLGEGEVLVVPLSREGAASAPSRR